MSSSGAAVGQNKFSPILVKSEAGQNVFPEEHGQAFRWCTCLFVPWASRKAWPRAGCLVGPRQQSFFLQVHFVGDPQEGLRRTWTVAGAGVSEWD